MFKTKIMVLVGVFSLVCSSAFADVDGYRGEVELKKKVGDVDVVVQERVDMDKNGKTQLHHTAIEGTTSLVKNVDIGAALQHSWSRNGKEWDTELRPTVFITPKLSLGIIDLSDKNSVDYRIQENASDEFYYKNKLTAMFPMRFFITNEFTYGFGEGKITLNELDLGKIFAVTKNVDIAVSYKISNDRVLDTSSSMIVATMGFRF